MLDDDIFKKLPKELSRRDMLKLSALIGGSALFNPLSASDLNVSATKVKSKAKIVIAGGGDAGVTIAARLQKLLEDPDITIIDPRALHYYQPGQTLVGSGIWSMKDIEFQLADVLPQGVKLIVEGVKAFDPDNNQLIIDSQKVISYDYLVVATGLESDFEAIKGLKKADMGMYGLASVYDATLSGKTFAQIQSLSNESKIHKVKALFTHPNTPIKCGGAPKKIMNLTEHYLRTQKSRDNAEINFLTPGDKYFGIDPYEDAVKKQFLQRGQEAKFQHELIAVDPQSKVATFRHEYEVQGAYDEDLKEYEMITHSKEIQLEYNFLHITPPMKAHDVVKNSALSWKKGSNGKFGLLEVDPVTLQHKRYANVFGAGDVIGTKYGKTGGSARKQAPVVAENLVAHMRGKLLNKKYNGYTVCPLITGYGEVMLAEFDYDGVAPTFPMDPTEQRWLWWLLKVYALKPIYFHGMLKGRM